MNMKKAIVVGATGGTGAVITAELVKGVACDCIWTVAAKAGGACKRTRQSFTSYVSNRGCIQAG